MDTLRPRPPSSAPALPCGSICAAAEVAQAQRATTNSSDSFSIAAITPSLQPSVRAIPQAMVVVAQIKVPPSLSPSPGTPAPGSLPELLHRLLPEHCPSVSAAKRVLRRRLVLRASQPTHGTVSGSAAASTSPYAPAAAEAGVAATTAPTAVVSTGSSSDGGDGGARIGSPPHPASEVLSTTHTVAPGDVLQLLARSGTGHMGWVAGAAAAPATTRSAPAAAERVEVAAAKVASQHGKTCGKPSGAKPGDGGGGAVSLQGLPVAFEDEHLAVVIKPPGIGTQGSGPGTVQGRLKYCLQPTTQLSALNRPQQVHRLDAPTSGLLLVAKTHAALRALAEDLHHRRISKRYCALVKGERTGSGTVDLPLSGKAAVTSFRAAPVSRSAPASAPSALPTPSPTPADCTFTTSGRRPAEADASGAAKATTSAKPAPAFADAPAVAVAAAGFTAGSSASGGGDGPADSCCRGERRRVLTKVLLWPHTGRTHQLRKHMAYTGTPILGDLRYRGPRAGEARADGTASAATSDDGDDDGGEGSCEAGAAEMANGGPGLGDGKDAVNSVADEGEDWDGGEGPPGGQAAACATEEGADIAGPGSSWGSFKASEDGEGGGDWEVHRPPADAGWALAAAQAAGAAVAGARGGLGRRRRDGGVSFDRLSDGSAVSLCLWAVGLRFRHPVTGHRLEVDISNWADAVYDSIIRRYHSAEGTGSGVVAVTAEGGAAGNGGQ